MDNKCFLYDICNHKDCGKFCVRKYKMDMLYSNALLTDAQKVHITLKVDEDGTDLEEFKQLAEIEKDILNFVQSGKNLYIYSSNCGNGKTSWSIRLIEAYFKKIWPMAGNSCKALFISVPRLLIALKDNISAKNDYVAFIKENINSADLVVWDDIATKTSTNFEIDNILPYITGRIYAGKANIYTSNLSPDGLYNALGKQIASRIANESKIINLKGADKRFLRVQ
jgi:DNA replication protein DnaC